MTQKLTTDEQYADEQALIDHLEGLMDDGGQGGEKWGPAQAAIAGIIAARQPEAPAPVNVPGAPTSCKACGSADLSWFAHSRNKSQVTEGRLCSRDVECVFVLGCDECSETLHVVTADTIAGLLAAPPVQSIETIRLEELGELAAMDLLEALTQHDRDEVGNG